MRQNDRLDEHQHVHKNGECLHQPTMQQQQNAKQQQKKHQKEVKSAFANYSKDMMASFDKIFNDNKIGKYYELVRERKRQKMKQALEANQNFLNLIIQSIQNEQQQKFVAQQITLCHNISKIRTTVKQFFREWCSQSPQVQDYIMLVEIAKKYLNKQDKILVPGCGLARLTLQLIEAGFAAQGNEVTYFMLYGSNFILNCVEKKEQFEIYPFIHTLASHENQQNMFRSVKIPDKVALEVVPQDADFSMVAGEFTQIYRQYHYKLAGIISCFFIDTANNIFDYIDTIFSSMKDGGIWINYGPLLYHYKDMLDQTSIQLSWEQVRAYILSKGFYQLEEHRKQTTYCHDPLSGYTHIYDILITVWEKPKMSQDSPQQK